MTLAQILNIDKDIILINNDKDVKFFSQDPIDMILEACQNIG